MSGELLALGVSHKTAPLAVRERLALPDRRAADVLAELTAHAAIHEAVAISTCNRAELYLMASDTVEAESAALGILAKQAEIRPTELTASLYAKRGVEAVRHLFGVAAGLESMIVGEAEIQGQVKRAYELARLEGATGPITNRLFMEALAAGKRVRTETSVGRSRVSVSSVAVELAAELLGDLSSRRVLVIGAGENGELTAKALRERGVHTVFVANRHYDRAIGLAQRFDGAAVRIDDLPVQLAAADIVVSCTSSPHQILGREELELVTREREGRRLVLIDIAVPRDVDASVRDLPGVTLFDMDDLQRAVTRTIDVREAEATRAQALVEQDTERFERWLSSLDVVPTIASLRARGNSIVEQVLRENEPRWESLSEADRKQLGVVARAVVSRMLHEPTMRLKGAVGEESAYVYVHALRELFGLDDAAPTLEDEQPAAAVTELETRRRRRG
ncbi:MAG TPA: glutamyl-tRNA reductase [Thermoleophilaceae bacterium]|nr:glutamyl-tRNA reductase [Thermoleophilaceae bacterium]